MVKTYSIDIYSIENNYKLVNSMYNVPYKALKEFVLSGRYSFDSINLYEVSYDASTKELVDLGYSKYAKYTITLKNISKKEAIEIINECFLSDIFL